MSEKFTAKDLEEFVELIKTQITDRTLCEIHADDKTKEANRLKNLEYDNKRFEEVKSTLYDAGIDIENKSVQCVLQELSEKWNSLK